MDCICGKRCTLCAAGWILHVQAKAPDFAAANLATLLWSVAELGQASKGLGMGMAARLQGLRGARCTAPPTPPLAYSSCARAKDGGGM